MKNEKKPILPLKVQNEALYGTILLSLLLVSMIAVTVIGSLVKSDNGRHPVRNLMIALKNGFETEENEFGIDDPAETDFPETDPIVTEPVVTEPGPTESVPDVETVPETITVPESVDPGATDPIDTSSPETTAPVTDVPVTKAPDTKPPVTTPPDTKPPVTTPPDTTPPVTTPPETTPPDPVPPETTPITDEERANDPNYFHDALFLGDSRTVGLATYGRIEGATYFARTSTNVKTLFADKKSETEKSGLNLTDFLKKNTFGKIYILLGINEIGYSYDWIVNYYKTDIETIRKLQPNAIIIIQSNMHVTKAKSDNNPTTFNNGRLNELNRRLSLLADNETIFYVNICPAFDDETGNMNPAYSGDGVHLKGKYYPLWRDYLVNYGKR